MQTVSAVINYLASLEKRSLEAIDVHQALIAEFPCMAFRRSAPAFEAAARLVVTTKYMSRLKRSNVVCLATIVNDLYNDIKQSAALCMGEEARHDSVYDNLIDLQVLNARVSLIEFIES